MNEGWALTHLISVILFIIFLIGWYIKYQKDKLLENVF